MTSFQQSIEFYEKQGKNFEQELMDYARNHYAHITPNCVILARCECNYWFIQFALGSGFLAYFVRIMPEYRPYIAFARPLKRGDEELKFYNTEKLKLLLL